MLMIKIQLRRPNPILRKFHRKTPPRIPHRRSLGRKPSPPPPSQSPPPPQLSPPPVHNASSSSPPRLSHKPPPPPPSPPERPSSSSSSSSPPSNDSPHKAMHEKSRDSHSHVSSPVEIVAYTLTGVLVVALVVFAVFFTFRKKKTKGDAYGGPFMPPPGTNFQVKSGADGLYYVQQPSIRNNYVATAGANSKKHIRRASVESVQPLSAQIVFSYDMVKEITNAFSSQNVIGEGGFGCVYKGKLLDGKEVAVKQLKVGSGQGDREFRAEVEIISRVHHRHLVSLVGYCISEQQRVLIYEFVPNGNLHHHLHGSGMPVLDWAKRVKIAIGAAKGLAYLHEDCKYIVQFYFWITYSCNAANTHVSTRVMGTFGYMAPEYATSGKLTDKSDVFSFGVVLLELVTGRKSIDETQPLGDESLVEWARPLLIHAFMTREFGELVDPRLENNYVESEMFGMIEAAAACVRHSAPKRPRMSQVVRALDSGDDISDLSNGVKYGQSTVYDSGQYDKEIMLFRRMGNESYGDSDIDKYSGESNPSKENLRSQHSWMHSTSSTESESRAFNKHQGRHE
ncbi:hypothetical protein RYX36_024944 [Vicia faba]